MSLYLLTVPSIAILYVVIFENIVNFNHFSKVTELAITRHIFYLESEENKLVEFKLQKM